MKNKKLFAILTLVCFMFTLMPVAAFAATDWSDYCVVATDKPEADSVTVKAGGSVKVATDATLDNLYFWVEDGNGDVEDLSTTSGSSTTFEFDTVGTYYVYAVSGSVVDVAKMEAAFYTDDEIVEFIKDKDEYIDDSLTVKVKKNSDAYVLVPAEGFATAEDEDGEEYSYISVTANNGWSSKDVAVKLEKNNDSSDAVKGAELTFSTNSSYINVELADGNETDRKGLVEFTVSASKAGNYKVYVKADGAEKLEIPVVVSASSVGSVETVAQPQTNVALGTTFFYDPGYGPTRYVGFTSVAFEFTSTDGTIIEEDGLDVYDEEKETGDYKITIVDQPADSTLDADDLTLRWDGNTNNAWVLFDEDNVASFDEEGKYVIKVSLENGESATATVNVAEFDEAARMILTMKANTVSYGDSVEVKAVSYMDANGTMMVSSHPDYADYGTVEYAASGKAVDTVDPESGKITAKDTDEEGDELIGTTITAFAINEDLELTATATITVVDQAAELKYQSTTADVAVNNKLIVNPVDEDGNVIAALDKNSSDVKVYVLDAPANAAYSAEAKVTDTDEITVTFTASAAGEYELQTVVRYGEKNTEYMSSVETITVGAGEADFEDIVVVSIGADKMIVNSEVVALDVAPFITNGRTMMQFNVLYVFGIDVDWVAETQSIIAEGEGLKVVMQLGSKVATVNGEEVALDVAPYTVNGRTVVPVGFITGLLDIAPVFTYNADGTIADILFAK